jgi:hypothetical protein
MQSMIIQVALPDWFFPSDKKFAPLVLLGLAFLGLAAPILAVSLYLWCSEGYVGANKISERTFLYYQKYGVKEMLRLPKIPEALVPSQEFVEIPFTRDQVSLHVCTSRMCVRACRRPPFFLGIFGFQYDHDDCQKRPGTSQISC